MVTPSVYKTVFLAVANPNTANVVDGILRRINERAFRAQSNLSMKLGLSLLALGFVWHILKAIYDVFQGRKDQVDILTPLVTLVFYVGLMSAYRPFVHGTMELIADFGAAVTYDETVAQAFQTRGRALGELLTHDGLAGYFKSSLPLRATVGLLYGVVSGSVFLLRAFQSFIIALIVAYGPLSLGFSYIGGPFAHLGTSWFWTLVEVSCWGLSLDILNFVFAPVAREIATQEYLVIEAGLCCTMIVLIALIPKATAMLVRGQSAGATSVSLAPMVNQAVSTTMRVAGVASKIA